MGWRGICAVLQRLSQKLATLAPTPNPSRLREGNVLDWPFPAIPKLSTRPNRLEHAPYADGNAPIPVSDISNDPQAEAG